MAVRPRVKPGSAVLKLADEDAVAAIINRGGGVAGSEMEGLDRLAVPGNAAPAAASPVSLAAVPAVPAAAAAVPVEPAASPVSPGEVEKKFTLRLPASLLAEIERDAKGRLDRISVNTWLIGAALQRLQKQHDDGKSPSP